MYPGSTGQLLQLRSVPDNRAMTILNTHRFSEASSAGPALRALHMAALLEAARKAIPAGCPLVLCGDLNLQPSSGVMKLLLEGAMPKLHI